jgi:hypothetical protein
LLVLVPPLQVQVQVLAQVQPFQGQIRDSIAVYTVLRFQVHALV